MDLYTLVQEKKEEIKAIAAKHGAYNVRLFGSVARKEASETSDIDFLIDFEIDKITPWFPVRLIRELESLLGQKVDIAIASDLKERFKDKILREALEL